MCCDQAMLAGGAIVCIVYNISCTSGDIVISSKQF